MRPLLPALLIASWLVHAEAAAAEYGAPPVVRPTRVTVGTAPVVAMPEGNLRITLLEVSDERCPIEMRCVWAGYAAVTLLIEHEEHGSTTIMLATVSDAERNLSTSQEVGDHRFELQRLNPRYSVRFKPSLADYRATILITPL